VTGANPFEALADAYDAWFDVHPALYESELQALRAVLRERTGAGFRVARIVQTLTDPSGVDRVEAPSEGFDRGSFVVVRGSVPTGNTKESTQS
jgi:hypothetical protein